MRNSPGTAGSAEPHHSQPGRAQSSEHPLGAPGTAMGSGNVQKGGNVAELSKYFKLRVALRSRCPPHPFPPSQSPSGHAGGFVPTFQGTFCHTSTLCHRGRRAGNNGNFLGGFKAKPTDRSCKKSSFTCLGQQKLPKLCLLPAAHQPLGVNEGPQITAGAQGDFSLS